VFSGVFRLLFLGLSSFSLLGLSFDSDIGPARFLFFLFLFPRGGFWRGGGKKRDFGMQDLLCAGRGKERANGSG